MPASRGVAAVLVERLDGDARPDERDALVQAEEVSAALGQQGFRVQRLETGLDLGDLLNRVRSLAPRFVFNLVESLAGNGALIAVVPALLRGAGLRVSGCDAEALWLTSQKVLAKRWLRRHDVPTPDWIENRPDVDRSSAAGRWIVKSVWEHASLGLDDGCVVSGAEEVAGRLRESKERHGGEWFAERFVDGREFNVSLLEIEGRPAVLPLAEIDFGTLPASRPRIVGYAAKWMPGSIEYRATERVFPPLPGPLAAELARLAERCWQLFGLAGAARVDVRLDAAGAPWVLEVNANPCLSRDAGFYAAAARYGLSYEAMVGHIATAALEPPP
ncbi:MAG TPA: hypothetical protein VFY03_10670 [Woeseiaceae bacterium]|nr:hypothetical protein [Woeseiaceae bacterium]